MDLFKENMPKIFVSSLKITDQTAKMLFPGKEYQIFPDVEEVPLRSYKDTKKKETIMVF